MEKELKSVFVVFNQAYYEHILDIMDKQAIRGFTHWDEVQGRGSRSGVPHLGSHAWPTLNSAMLIILEASKVEALLAALRKLDRRSEDQGLRAFVWDIQQSI